MNNDMCLVSIIIPVYNSEKYIKECLESICNQTYKKIEIIIIDDGSTDSSLCICEFVSKNDCRIDVYHQDNVGVSAARNIGLSHVNGEYCMFVDSDDILDEFFVEKSLESFSIVDVDLYVGGFTTFGGNVNRTFCRESRKVYKKKELFEDIGKSFHSEWIGMIGGKVYKTKIIQSNNMMFDESLNFGEDACFNFLYISYSKRIFFDNTALYQYRQSNKSSLGSAIHKDIINIHEKVFAIKRKIMMESGVTKDFCDYYAAKTFYGDLLTMYLHYDKFPSCERINSIECVYKMDCIKALNVNMEKRTEIKIAFFLLKKESAYLLNVYIKLLCFLIHLKQKGLIKIYDRK